MKVSRTKLIQFNKSMTYKQFMKRGGLQARAPKTRTRDPIKKTDRIDILLGRMFYDGHMPLGSPEEVARDPEVIDYHDGWPEWVSVNRLAELLSTMMDQKVHPSSVGSYLLNSVPGIERRVVEILRKSRGGQVKYRVDRVFYRVGPFRGDILTRTYATC